MDLRMSVCQGWPIYQNPFFFCEGYCAPNHYSTNGLEPCLPCEKAVSYQPEFGETSCIPCRSEKDDPSCDKGDSEHTAWINTNYTTCAFAWDSLTYSGNIIQQVTFPVSIPNVIVWVTINNLATQALQPWASKAFRDLAREVDWCEVHLQILLHWQVIEL